MSAKPDYTEPELKFRNAVLKTVDREVGGMFDGWYVKFDRTDDGLLLAYLGALYGSRIYHATLIDADQPDCISVERPWPCFQLADGTRLQFNAANVFAVWFCELAYELRNSAPAGS